MESTVTKFEVGQTYAGRFMSDYDSIAYFKILKRTAKTVTFQYHNEVQRRGVTVASYDQAERFKPFGSYSMAMIVTANDTADKFRR